MCRPTDFPPYGENEIETEIAEHNADCDTLRETGNPCDFVIELEEKMRMLTNEPNPFILCNCKYSPTLGHEPACEFIRAQRAASATSPWVRRALANDLPVFDTLQGNRTYEARQSDANPFDVHPDF